MPPTTKDALCAPGEDVAILFARAPVPGQVKTRLIDSGPQRLSAEQACALHVACTGDVADLLDRALPSARKWLFWSKAPSAEYPLAGLRLPSSFGITLQSGLDLGERMGRALERTLRSEAARVLLVGSDSPTLPEAYLQKALELLGTSDVVLGPSEDGGFYLIACRRFDRGLFNEVEWGGPDVSARTQTNARHLGISLGILPRWYDLDQWSNVERMIEESHAGAPLPSRLAEFFGASNTQSS
ncbi:MAG: glycosyltransferase [Acidobacteria bacterium]|nr:glycosyltransferase [Acidobacteriota bacterium]